MATRRLTKDELRDANCCRFCGVRPSSENPSVSFVPVFDKCDLPGERLKGPLDTLINKWLPIKVNSDDAYYPRFICSYCYYRLEETVAFFEIILSGQRFLADIINKGIKVDLDYSESNPLLSAPRRRGRPKKDPNAPKQAKKKELSMNSGIVEVMDKPKRITKPPKRYGEEEHKLEIKEENPDTVPEEPNMEISKDPFIQFIGTDCPRNEKVEFGDDEMLNFGMIMEGDTFIEAVIGNTVDVQTEKSRNDNDSDASVRTVDFVQNKLKKKKKRKRRNEKKKMKGKISCPYPNCDFESAYTSSLNYHHQRVHVRTLRSFCQICGRGFTHEKLLKLHLLSHSQEKKIKCSECIAKFKTKSSLYTHRRTVHLKSQDYKCEVCEMSFSLKSSLTAHIRLHTGSKPYSCKYCGKSFTQDSNLKAHIRTHTGDRPFKCDWEDCSKAFVTSSQLRIHKSTHSGGKPFLCSECGRGFASRMTFKHHQTKHTGEKPYTCQDCHSSFPSPWGFNRHRKLHTQDKPYRCAICVRGFKDPSNLNKHIKTHEKKGQELLQQQQQAVEETEPMLEILNAESLLDGSEEHGSVVYFSPEVLPPYITITLNEENETMTGSNNPITLESLGMPITFTTLEGETDFYTLTGTSNENIEDRITELEISNSVDGEAIRISSEEFKFVLQDPSLLQEALNLNEQLSQIQ